MLVIVSCGKCHLVSRATVSPEELTVNPPPALSTAVSATVTGRRVSTRVHRRIRCLPSCSARSSTYRSKGFDVTVKYTQGSWTGFVGEDVVTIPKGFNSSFLVNIATIFESENFFLPGVKWNGILGLAYAALAKVRPAWA